MGLGNKKQQETVKLDWEKFKDLFGTWGDHIKPFFDSGEMDKIYSHLKRRSKEGKIILPESKNTFRCFIETPIESTQVVMMGMCPYDGIWDNKAVADGLLMGCSNTGRLQPSLSKFYEALEEEFFEGLGLGCVLNPDLSYLAHQGVLMFNAALTVEKGKAGSHNDIWEPFTTYMFTEIISRKGWPVIFLGTEAQYFEPYMAPLQWGFKLYHPAYASYKKEKWNTNGVFTSVNKILKDNKQEPITWIEELPF